MNNNFFFAILTGTTNLYLKCKTKIFKYLGLNGIHKEHTYKIKLINKDNVGKC